MRYLSMCMGVATMAILQFGIVGHVDGTILIRPTAAVATDTHSAPYGPGFVIDGSGLSDSTIVETGDETPAVYPMHTNVNPNVMWFAYDRFSAGPRPSITFDLGAEYTVGGLHVWNYNDPVIAGPSNLEQAMTNSGIKDVEVTFSTTAIDAGFGAPEVLEFAKGTGLNDYTGEDLLFSTTYAARYIKFQPTSNHGHVWHYTGLSEVRFFDTSGGGTVPEPTTLTTLSILLTLAGLTWLWRRRQSNVS